MDETTLKRLLPRSSKAVVDLNCRPSGSDPQSSVRHGALAKSKTQEGDTPKRMVSIVSYRVRLADVDGLCGKWHLDALRYAGVIKDDTEKDITYQISQKKVSQKSEEKTLISIS